MKRWKKIVWFILLAVMVLVFAGIGWVYWLITDRVEGDYFESDGIRIHYTDEGDGEPVVLLHGFAVHADLNWRKPGITEKIAGDFRVIGVDLRGHGLSDKPHEVERCGLEMVKDVARLLDHLKIERAHIVGYSLGGFIALKFATLHPEKLLTLSVLGAGWERPEGGAFMDALAEMAEDLKAGRSINPLAGKLGGPGRAKPNFMHRMWIKVLTSGSNDRLALAAVVGSVPALGITEEELKGIEVPVLSVVGDNDPLLVGARAMNERVGDLTQIIVPGVDHIHLPRRAEMSDGLLAFLRAHQEKE